MSSQTSKAALQGLRQAEWLATSTTVQKPRVSAALGELYGSTQPDGADNPALADWNVVQDSNVLLLQHSAKNLRQADQAHRENLVVLEEVRGRRRRMVAGFKKRYRDEQKSFGGTYSEEALADLRLDAPPATTYLGIREQLLEFRERLLDLATPDKLPNPSPGHRPIELQPIGEAIGGEIETYDHLMTEIREQRKRADETLIAKQQALKENRRMIVNVGRRAGRALPPGGSRRPRRPHPRGDPAAAQAQAEGDAGGGGDARERGTAVRGARSPRSPSPRNPSPGSRPRPPSRAGGGGLDAALCPRRGAVAPPPPPGTPPGGDADCPSEPRPQTNEDATSRAGGGSDSEA